MNAKQLKTVRSQLDNFLEELLNPIGRSERRKWSAQYVKGLLSEAERKTISSIADRSLENNPQAIQQMIHSSPWDSSPVRLAMSQKAISELEPIKASIVDDTGFPKKGKHSAGVARQYSGTLGKVDNCQVAVSLHWATGQCSFPLDWSLYLPKEWTDDPERCRKAGIPEDVTFRKKWELALDMVDRALENGIDLGVLTADHDYGVNTNFRRGLESRNVLYSVAIDKAMVFWKHPVKRKPVPYSGRGRRPAPRYDPSIPPETAEIIASSIPEEDWKIIIYGKGTKKKLSDEFAAIRVQPAHNHQHKEPEMSMVWLLFQRTPGEKMPSNYFLSSMDESTTLARLVKITKLRWRIERDYQILKGEIGLDHYEVRNWQGWHHHVTLATMAYIFLLLIQSIDDFPPSNLAGN